MAWVYLMMAGMLEVVFAISLKYSQGFTRLIPTLIFLPASIASFYLLTRALRTLPVGTGYAVWTSIGAAGTAIVGMIFLGESRDPWKLLSLAALVSGIIGLRLTGGAH